jgi:enediyne polyketide synthase
MGQRFGRIDVLASQGISPISIDDGVEEFLRAVDMPDLPVRLVISGRFGTAPTIVYNRRPLVPFRFLESCLVYYPATELIAECTVSPTANPYLDDHVLNSERLFPAVMALEAMSQVAVTLMGHDATSVVPLFRNVIFRKAIALPLGADAEAVTLRLIGLADASDDISLVIRCSTTNFQMDHIEAHCTLRKRREVEVVEPDAQLVPAKEFLPSDPDQALYQNVLFQSGRFRRVQGYYLIEAHRCSGQLSSAESTSGSFAVGVGILLLPLTCCDEVVGGHRLQSRRADGSPCSPIGAAVGVCRSTQTVSVARSSIAPSAQTNS